MFKFKIKNDVLIKYRGLNKNVVIPDGVRTIGKNAFKHCFFIKSITIPDSVTIINEYGFAKCGIESINIPDNVLRIGKGAFLGCKKLTSINFTEGLLEIGGFAFACCVQLKSITIPCNVYYIGTGIFADCISLSSVKVDENNKSYDSRNNCNAIIDTDNKALVAACRSTVIPDTVKLIWTCAIDAINIESISIPNSVETIMPLAFNLNMYLKHVDLSNVDHVIKIGEYEESLNVPKEKILFRGSNRKLKIKVKPSLLSDYKNAPMWKNISDSII